MSKQIFFTISTETGKSVTSIKELEKEIKLLRDEWKKTDDAVQRNKIGESLKNAKSELTSFNNSIKDTQSFTQKMAGAFTDSLKNVGGLVAGAFAVNSVINFGKESIKAFQEAELNAKKLETAVKVGGGLQTDFDNLIKQSSILESKTIFSDDAIQQAQTMALQFGLNSKEVKNLLPIITDFASATNQDLGSAMETVIRGIEGSAKGLKIYGIELKDGASQAENFATITEQLTKKFEGQAEVIGNTTTGRMAKLSNIIDNIKESIGGGLLNTFGVFIDLTEQLIKPSESLSNAFENQSTNLNHLKKDIIPMLDRYDELKSKTNLSKTEHIELNKILSIISKELPTSVTKWDNYGNALEISTGKSKDLIKAQEDLNSLLNKDLISEIGKKYTEDANKRKELLESLKKGTKEVTETIKKAGGEFEIKTKVVPLSDFEISEIRKEIDTLNKSIQAGVNQRNLLLGKSPITTTNNNQNSGLSTETETPEEKAARLKKEGEDAARLEKEKQDRILKLNIQNIEKTRSINDIATKERYLKGQLSEEQYTQQLYTNEVAYYESLKFLYQGNESELNNINNKILENDKKRLDVEIANKKKQQEELKTAAQKFIDDNNKTGEEQQKVKDKLEEDKKKFTEDADKALKQAELDGAAQLASGILAIEQQLSQERTQIALQGVQDRLSTELSAIDEAQAREEGTWVERTAVQKKYDKQRELARKKAADEERKIKQEEWKKNQQFAIAQATIATALAVLNALGTPNPTGAIGATTLAIEAGIAGAVQIALIAATPMPKFARGGILNGNSHSMGGIPIMVSGGQVAEAEGGEIILTKGVSTNPLLRTIASNLNVAGGGQSFVPNSTSLMTNNLLSSMSTIGQNNDNMLTSVLMELRQQLSVPSRSYVVEQEISDIQSKNNIINRRSKI